VTSEGLIFEMIKGKILDKEAMVLLYSKVVTCSESSRKSRMYLNVAFIEGNSRFLCAMR